MSNNALEDLQAGRDPWADSSSSPSKFSVDESGEAFCYTAAKLCFWLPIVAGLLCGGIVEALHGSQVSTQTSFWLRMGALGVAGLMVLASLVFGLIALCAIPRFGQEGLLLRSIRGMVISGGLIVAVVTGFGYAARNHLVTSRMDETMQKMQADMKKDVASGKEISGDDQVKRLGAMKQAMDVAAREGTGATAMFAKVMSAFAQKIEVPLKGYADAAKNLHGATVLNMEGVDKLEQLESRKQTVRDFLAANDQLLGFIQNSEKIFKQELDRINLPADQAQQALEGFRKGIAPKNAVSVKIRGEDKRAGKDMLAVLDLLQSNWGKWKYNSGKKLVV
ncbi:MAG TPA: hypothetical protein VH598_01935, partial [Verrucomicrobiae bacterium]|nr:hypothetical protein [Verrucomicrobiae bacterium]